MSVKDQETRREYLRRYRDRHIAGVTASGFTGVRLTANPSNPWQARMTVDGKLVNLGVFSCEIDAARAYDKAAIEHYGFAADINCPSDYPDWMAAKTMQLEKYRDIARRIICGDETVCSIAIDEGCSPSRICIIYRMFTTKDERLKAKHRKTAKSNTGRPNPKLTQWVKQHGPANKGKPMDQELKEKLRLLNTGRKVTVERRIAQSAMMLGIPVEQWTGFASSHMTEIKNSSEYKKWRKDVYERDDWTCQNCRSRGVRLHAHHIKPKSQFPELIFEVDNGLTLCVKCHHKAHTKMEEARNGFVICRLRRNVNQDEGRKQ